MLQRVDLQHHVKGVVTKGAQAVFQVELQHIDTAAHAGQHLGIVDLHTVAAATARGLQVGQHGTVATAQVEHARAGGNETGDALHQAGIAHHSPPAMVWSK
ncbi:hypothetical protein D9M69_654340 [compost metagenome]